jgi:predicted O-linked N-acetylglucosamine transferase (SPINDLY family)
LLYLNYSDRHSAAEIAKEHFRLGMRFGERSERVAKRNRNSSDRIRIGYLASDFYTHPVGKIMLPILQSHDRQRFDVRVFHGSNKTDATTRATREAVDGFTTIHGWTDDRVVDVIRGEAIDVLVDLGGYTGGGNRLRALSRRLAAVQASFLGYPNTSALPTIDYHLTDRFADPPGTADRMYGERLVWLRHAHIAWRPYEMAREITGRLPDAPTLGVFNKVAKISPQAIAAYAQILSRVPEAKIEFKYGDRFGVLLLQDRYRREFAAQGVLPDRIRFHGRAETLSDHLRMMASVDMALDSFPYQGTMTSLECLSVGTPILSCCGDYYAHRATSAMMLRMGMHELVAASVDEYIELAVELLHQVDELRNMRQEILHRFYESPLTDVDGLTRELESIFLGWVQSP